MNATMNWIGGTALAAALVIGTALTGSTLPEDLAVGPQTGTQTRIEPIDVLSPDAAGDTAEVTLAVSQDEPAAAPSPTSAPASASAPSAAPTTQAAPLVIKRILPISGPIKYGEWHWDDEGVPDGPLIVTVDLEARVISVFRDGYEIGAAAALLGTPEHPTPVGTFPILTKERHNISEKYGNAPMPWTLRLTWDGVAIHGGSTVENGYASHGCIGVPDEFVSRLYAIAKKGDRVIITNGQRASVGTSLASN